MGIGRVYQILGLTTAIALGSSNATGIASAATAAPSASPTPTNRVA